MAQQGNTVNFLIQDANGQTQVIKVLQSTPGKLTTPGGRTTNVVSSVANQGVKTIFKTPGQGAGQGTSLLASGTQVLRTLSLQQSPKKTVQRPHVVAMIQSNNAKTSPVKLESPILPKTIHIASNPMVLSTQQRLAAQHVLPPSNAQKNFISPILDHSGSRKRQESENDFMPEYKRRKTDKVGKGLRHFSMKVCEKVRKKGTTSYNEVADELVSEFTNPSLMNCPKDQQYDQKNIRRRVYDALNVLMAMNIISKEKKEIRWLGLPTNSLQEVINLQKDKQRRVDRIRQKKQQLHDLILQQISFKNLVERNRLQEQQTGIPATNSAIQLPFIIINTNRQTVIDCSISNDKSEYLFNFDDKFEIHDDIEVLKRMGMVMGLDKAECTPDNVLKAKSMVPKALGSYIDELSVGPLEDEEEMMDETETVPGPSVVGIEMPDLELSRQSSHTSMSDADPMSPTMNDFSDEESEASSDLEVN